MWVHIPNDEISIASYLAKPSGTGPFPCVLVLQEIFGVNTHIRETVRRLAQEGFIALAPALFQRTAPGLDIGYEAGDVALGRSHKDKTTAALLVSDLKACLSYLKAQPEAQKEKMGVVGFCFGGHVAFLSATLPAIKAAACFYGAGIATTTPGGGPASLSRASEIKGEIHFFFGDRDSLIPPDQIEKIDSELKRVGASYSIHRYPTGHGFFCSHRPDFDANAAEDAWKKTIALFKRQLSPMA